MTESTRWTLGYYIAFICYGLTVAVIGPTLPALAQQTHSVLAEMGALFVAGSAGQTLGTIAGGRIYDQRPGHRVMGLAQLSIGAFVLLVPVCASFWLLLAIWALKGFADGLVNTGGNTLLVWTHGNRVAPYMNGLHFCFGLGAFLAPLLVAQVIGNPDGYRWAYWTLAGAAALASLPLLASIRSPQRGHVQFANAEEMASFDRAYYPLVAAAALFLFFYVGAELAFAGWAYTYTVSLKLAGPVGAAYLTSGFWLLFTVGRLLSIPRSARFAAQSIVLMDLSACLGIVALAIAVPGSSLVWWIVALSLGFFMAALWPTGFALAGRWIPFTARASGIILLGDSLGAMTLPWLAGQVLGSVGPRAMVFLVFGALVLDLFAFLAMLRLRPRAHSS